MGRCQWHVPHSSSKVFSFLSTPSLQGWVEMRFLLMMSSIISLTSYPITGESTRFQALLKELSFQGQAIRGSHLLEEGNM